MKRRHSPALLLLIVALAAPAVADPLPTAAPESLGLSSERLRRITETAMSPSGRELLARCRPLPTNAA